MNLSHVASSNRILAFRLGAVLLVALGSVALWPRPAEAGTCTVPNSFSNGQVADATAVMGNFNALKDCVDAAVVPSGTPVAGNISVFSSSDTVTNSNLTGDCTTAGTVATTCTKTNGTSFGYFATGSDAGQLTGTIPVERFNGGTNADSTHFLRGDGVWAPAPGGGASTAYWWSGFQPHAADFSTAFTGSGSNATLTDDPDVGLVLKANNAANATFTTRGWGKALPSGAWSVKARITANIYNANYNGAGLYIYESGTNKIAATALMYDGGLWADSIGGTLTTFTARGARYLNDSVLWVRIDYDGTTNYTFFVSHDGKNWLTTRVVAKTTLFTSAATHVGPGVTIQNAQTDAAVEGLACDYWNQSW